MTHRIEIAIAAAMALAACGHGDRTLVAASGSAGSDGSDGSGSGSGRIAEPSRDDDGPRLDFVITKTYAHQQPSDAAPYHVDGGAWTYADAHVAGDDAATFGFGVPAFDAGGEMRFAKMMLVPTTPEAGARVATAFAHAFHVTASPPQPGGRPVAVRVPIAVLGHDVARGAGFSGHGTWDALKWFCPTLGDEPPEVFFNVDLADRRGEWTEKDGDYDVAVAGFLASTLRDGPPPPRTPQNDPTFAASGPRVVLGKKFRDNAVTIIKLTATRAVLTEVAGDHRHVLALDPQTGGVTTLYDTTDEVADGSCDDSALLCAFGLHALHDGSYNAGAPARVLLVDGSDARVVPELAGTATPTTAAVSPGGDWVVTGEDNTLIAWSRATGHTVTIHTPDGTSAYVESWRRDGKSWTALVSAAKFGKADQETRYTGFRWAMAHPETLAPNPEAPNPESAPLTSPNGSRTAGISDGRLVVTRRTGAPRTLVFQPADASAATHTSKWLDDRYLVVQTEPLRFIDTDAMKVSLMPPLAGVDPKARVEVATGVGVAIVVDEHASYLSTIETKSSP